MYSAGVTWHVATHGYVYLDKKSGVEGGGMIYDTGAVDDTKCMIRRRGRRRLGTLRLESQHIDLKLLQTHILRCGADDSER